MVKKVILRVSDDVLESVVLGNEDEFREMLKNFGARCLVDEDNGDTFYGSSQLRDGATYSFKKSK